MHYKILHFNEVGSTTCGPATVEEIQELFESLSAGGRTIRFCRKCSSAMLFADAMFCLWEGDRSWSVPVPVCPKCDLTLEITNSISQNSA